MDKSDGQMNMTWIELWRYARADRGRTLRLLCLGFVVGGCLALLIGTIIAAVL